MKIPLSILLITVVSFVSIAQKTVRVSEKIEKVNVFLNNCQITSTAAVSIPAGSSKIIIQNVASTIDPNTIQIGGKGDFTLLGVKHRPDFLNSITNILQDSIKIVKANIENIEVNISVANNEEKMIMANASIKSEKDGVFPEDLKEMIEFFRTSLTTVGTRKLQLIRSLSTQTEKLKKLESQLNERMRNNRPLGEIELSIVSSKGSKAIFDLTYIAQSAGWRPSYDLRVKDLKSKVNVAYKALVYQHTGVDWSNVKLVLSTNNPSLNNQKPELYPQFLSFWIPAPVYSRNMRLKQEDGIAYAAAAPMVADMEMKSISNEVVVSQSALSVNFEIPTTYSIISGGEGETVEIQNFDIEAKYDNKIAPKLDPNSYLTATISDWEKYNLISGEASVYFEEKYVGKTYLNENNIKEKLEISLGKNPRIYAKREEIENFKARKTFGSNVKESFVYRITIKNNTSEDINLSVEDQIPVSQDSNIDVEIDEVSGAAIDKLTGKITWDLMMQGFETKELIIKFTVKYPKDRKINNL